MKKFIFTVLILCLLKPMFSNESEDSSAVIIDSSDASSDVDAASDVVADAGTDIDADAEVEVEAEAEPAAKDAEEGDEKAHLLGVVSRGTWCQNNVVPCRDECCRLNWWGRRRCCFHKSWSPCCGGFQWHFPGYMVASTWKGAVPNPLGFHYHHNHRSGHSHAQHNHPHGHNHAHPHSH